MHLVEQARYRLRRANTSLLTLGIACLLVALIGEGLTIGGVSVSGIFPWWQHAALAFAGLVFISLSLVVGVQLPDRPAPPMGGFLGAPPHRTSSSRFVPRPDEMRLLISALTAGGARPVALVGMGGVGKTVLATEAARAPDMFRSFPGGVTWLDVGQRPDVVALQALLARRLDERAPGITTITDGRDLLRKLLAERKMLIVLDNVWERDVVDAFDDLGPGCRLLFTTRYAELARGVDAVQLEVATLTRDQALELLGRWTGTDVDSMPLIAEDICRRLDNLALGVALVGAMLVQRGRTWQDVLQLLEDADIEQIRADFGQHYPHPNLLAAIELSIDGLPDDLTRQLYLRLAVFSGRGPFPRSAAESLWAESGRTGPQVGELLALLEGRSLLLAEGTDRFWVHDLQMDVIVKQLGPSNLIRAHDLLVNGYRARCAGGWPSGPDDGYFLENIAYHLARSDRLEELGELLIDLSWMWIRLTATDLAGLLTDYAHAADGPVAEAVRAALALSAGALASDPHQLPGHLVGRLTDHPNPAVRAAVEGWRRWDGWPWLCPSTAGLISTTGPLRAVLRGHDGSVEALAVGPEGKLVVSGGKDGTVRLWELASGRLERSLTAHTGSVTAVAISPDGQMVVSAGYDQTVQAWEVASGRLLRTLEGPTSWVRSLTVSPDGRSVAAASGYDEYNKYMGGTGILRVWDVSSGQLASTVEGHSWPPAGGWHTSGREAIAVSPDGQMVVSAGRDGPIRLWEGASGRLARTLEGHVGWVTAIAISSDGRLVVSASDDGTVRVWELGTGSLIRTLDGYSRWVTAVAVSNTGRLVVSAGSDGTVRAWDFASERVVRSQESHTDWVRAIAVSQDGQFVFSGGDDRTVRVRELASDRPLRTLNGHTDMVWAVTVSSDGRLVASAGRDGTVRVWEVATGRQLWVWEVATGSVYSVALSPDGRLVVCAGEKSSIDVWEVSTGRLVRTLEGHARWVRAVAVSRDGQLVVSGGEDGTVRLWELGTGRLLRTLEGHYRYSVWAVGFGHDGQHVISGAQDATARVWEVASGRLLCTLEGHTDWITGVALSADGRLALSVAFDNTARVWELASRDELARWLGDYKIISGCAVGSSRPLTIALGDETGTVYTVQLH